MECVLTADCTTQDSVSYSGEDLVVRQLKQTHRQTHTTDLRES